MKNRIYSYTIMTFFFMIFFIFIQQLWQGYTLGISAALFCYALIMGVVSAVIMEAWRYFLPLIYTKKRILYLCLLLFHPLLWLLPIFKTWTLILFFIYVTILMGNQLFVYCEANEKLKQMQEHLK